MNKTKNIVFTLPSLAAAIIFGVFLCIVSESSGYEWILSCFVPRPRYCARPMRFASRGRSSRIRHRNALTKKAWEDAIRGLNKILSTDAKVIMTNQTLRYSKNYDIVRSSRTKDQGLG